MNDRSHDGISAKNQQFPRLAEFCQGYLHQDFLDEYGSVESAASTYLSDANPNQVRQLRSEWEKFLEVVREHASTPSSQLSSFRKALVELGSSWRPQTLADIDTLTKIFAAHGK
ncbi:MAG: hypothetical protein DMG86_04045 [Acidobacteria bacterium]|nr:MAG: hypothetical protein DMG86_04045 [Acidobacteriota bacterium]PYX11854.1 MAG: hypothetical protein DMG84_23040 [Acidobacteriota bacterium]